MGVIPAFKKSPVVSRKGCLDRVQAADCPIFQQAGGVGPRVPASQLPSSKQMRGLAEPGSGYNQPQR